MKSYETVVIGAGPGGYEAALEVAREEKKVLLIDRAKERIGGTCLNEGCIPTKNYLQSAEYISRASYFADRGLAIEVGGLDLHRLAEKTTALINEIRSGIVWLLDQAGVETMYGSAMFVDEHTLDVSGERIGFQKCIIATGSQVRQVPEIVMDGKRILSSSDVFGLDMLPRSIAIVGGGAIGCEFATFFSAFGVEVTLIARSPQLLPLEDEEVSKALLRSFKKHGIRVLTSTPVLRVQTEKGGVSVDVGGEHPESIRSEMLLSATGRIPNTEGLNVQNAGVNLDDRGYVDVDESFRTSQSHIYAIGDCINTAAYAHTAYAEARIAARNLIHGVSAPNDHITPSAIFTNPPIASCGMSEKEAVQQGRAVIVNKAYFKANAKAKILGDDSGMAKIIICSETGSILGGSLIGAESTEIIHELVVAVEKKLTLKELTEMIHVHPTVSEIFRSI